MQDTEIINKILEANAAPEYQSKLYEMVCERALEEALHQGGKTPNETTRRAMEEGSKLLETGGRGMTIDELFAELDEAAAQELQQLIKKREYAVKVQQDEYETYRTPSHKPGEGTITMQEMTELLKKTRQGGKTEMCNAVMDGILKDGRKVFYVDTSNLDADKQREYLAKVQQDVYTAREQQKYILDRMVEVELTRPDAFLIVKETLTRIGVASEGQNRLHQSCHILHKGGKYYITHFKLLFELDGKNSNIDQQDIARQNTIAALLVSWGLVKFTKPDVNMSLAPMKSIKIVPASEKRNWELISKHRIGKK